MRSDEIIYGYAPTGFLDTIELNPTKSYTGIPRHVFLTLYWKRLDKMRHGYAQTGFPDTIGLDRAKSYVLLVTNFGSLITEISLVVVTRGRVRVPLRMRGLLIKKRKHRWKCSAVFCILLWCVVMELNAETKQCRSAFLWKKSNVSYMVGNWTIGM